MGGRVASQGGEAQSGRAAILGCGTGRAILGCGTGKTVLGAVRGIEQLHRLHRGESVGQNPRRAAHQVDKLHERFAALIRANHDAILRSYQTNLETSHSPVVDNPCCRGQMITNAAEIITDVVESVQAGRIRIDDRYRLLTWTIGETRAQNQVSPVDALSAAIALFNATITSLADYVRDDPELLPCFVIAVLALNESTSLRIREATLAYTGYLLNRIHHAYLDERYRVARELDDRLGEGLSAALRQLELQELTGPEDPLRSALQSALGKQALVEGMRRLRLVVSELRQDPVTSLEKALTHYLDSVATDADVQLRVSGDETWASSTVVDETYLIIREAIRNTLTHGAPAHVLVSVDLAPHELRAAVRDDGRGFVPTQRAASEFPHTGGLASMRERAALIGGRLTVSSVPGRGTHVELVVPLAGHRDDESSLYYEPQPPQRSQPPRNPWQSTTSPCRLGPSNSGLSECLINGRAGLGGGP